MSTRAIPLRETYAINSPLSEAYLAARLSPLREPMAAVVAARASRSSIARDGSLRVESDVIGADAADEEARHDALDCGAALALAALGPFPSVGQHGARQAGVRTQILPLPPRTIWRDADDGAGVAAAGDTQAAKELVEVKAELQPHRNPNREAMRCS